MRIATAYVRISPYHPSSYYVLSCSMLRIMAKIDFLENLKLFAGFKHKNCDIFVPTPPFLYLKVQITMPLCACGEKYFNVATPGNQTLGKVG